MSSVQTLRKPIQTSPRKYRKRPNPSTYEPDSIFFIKSQVRLGTIITYYGRLDPMSKWKVVQIVTVLPGKRYRTELLPEVSKLHDTVYLQRVDDLNECRSVTFGYMSYSALWRINAQVVE